MAEQPETSAQQPEHNHPDTANNIERLSVRDLGVSFSGNKAIRNISMTFNDGRATAIIGPSGCGKSTLLRALNRMHDIVPGAEVTGDILLDGENVMTMDAVAVRRRIGMVFQKP
ncbi:MAG: ATP-binding cassette domain-containing protein, partial [Bacteriodetes bacterium]|nr:ATP-binding cassette domain-containing protein [Bacteroidota bacterium]